MPGRVKREVCNEAHLFQALRSGTTPDSVRIREVHQVKPGGVIEVVLDNSPVGGKPMNIHQRVAYFIGHEPEVRATQQPGQSFSQTHIQPRPNSVVVIQEIDDGTYIDNQVYICGYGVELVDEVNAGILAQLERMNIHMTPAAAPA